MNTEKIDKVNSEKMDSKELSLEGTKLFSNLEKAGHLLTLAVEKVNKRTLTERRTRLEGEIRVGEMEQIAYEYGDNTNQKGTPEDLRELGGLMLVKKIHPDSQDVDALVTQEKNRVKTRYERSRLTNALSKSALGKRLGVKPIYGNADQINVLGDKVDLMASLLNKIPKGEENTYIDACIAEKHEFEKTQTDLPNSGEVLENYKLVIPAIQSLTKIRNQY